MNYHLSFLLIGVLFSFIDTFIFHGDLKILIVFAGIACVLVFARCSTNIDW